LRGTKLKKYNNYNTTTVKNKQEKKEKGHSELSREKGIDPCIYSKEQNEKITTIKRRYQPDGQY